MLNVIVAIQEDHRVVRIVSMKKNIFLFWIIILSIGLKGQGVSDELRGRVSFLSSRNVYVKFSTTNGISAGDTLYKSIKGKMTPVLKVINLSSSSCLCSQISGLNLAVSDEIIGRKKSLNTSQSRSSGETTVKQVPKVVSADTVNKQSKPQYSKQKITGSISACSFSGFSTMPGNNSTRLRYTLSMNARNISDSKFSVESYISFNYKPGDWNAVKSNIFNEC